MDQIRDIVFIELTSDQYVCPTFCKFLVGAAAVQPLTYLWLRVWWLRTRAIHCTSCVCSMTTWSELSLQFGMFQTHITRHFVAATISSAKNKLPHQKWRSSRTLNMSGQMLCRIVGVFLIRNCSMDFLFWLLYRAFSLYVVQPTNAQSYFII